MLSAEARLLLLAIAPSMKGHWPPRDQRQGVHRQDIRAASDVIIVVIARNEALALQRHGRSHPSIR